MEANTANGLPTAANDRSPFAFLEGESDETIAFVNGLIRNTQLKPKGRDKSIIGLLSDDSVEKYYAFKNEIKWEIPTALTYLPPEDNQQIRAWISRKYYKKPDPEVDECSIEEILKAAKDKLEYFEKSRSCHNGTLSPKSLDGFLRVESGSLCPDKHVPGQTSAHLHGHYGYNTSYEEWKRLAESSAARGQPIPTPVDIWQMAETAERRLYDLIEQFKSSKMDNDRLKEDKYILEKKLHEAEERITELQSRADRLEMENSELKRIQQSQKLDENERTQLERHYEQETEEMSRRYLEEFRKLEQRLKEAQELAELRRTLIPVKTINDTAYESGKTIFHDAKDTLDKAQDALLASDLEHGYSVGQGNHLVTTPMRGSVEQSPKKSLSPYPSLPLDRVSLSAPVPQDPVLSKEENSLNVMLIGESGVGKSTLINAFENLLKYKSLDEALARGPCVPIRTSFDMVIEGTGMTGIKVEPPYNAEEYANELLYSESGQSRTQKAKIYKFRSMINGQEQLVKVIDTPGVLDTRGDDKDKENYYRTMDVIKELKSIHAVCILLKPNEARFTTEFARALDMLLKRLPRSAIKRIVFGFTCTEPFNFLPSQTLTILRQYLKELGTRTKIKVKAEDNIFCFDNNCFRFQCAAKVHPDYARKKNLYEKSWNNNANQLQSMLGYIQSLTPYATADAINIATVEKRLQNLVDTFINIISDHVQEIQTLNGLIKTASSFYLQKYTKQIEERQKACDYVLKCCCYFTVFLQRNACGIEDVFGMKLQSLINEKEQASKCLKGTDIIREELKRIANEYYNITAVLTGKAKKDNDMVTPEEIEKLLINVNRLGYYGGRITVAEQNVAKSSSFRNTPV